MRPKYRVHNLFVQECPRCGIIANFGPDNNYTCWNCGYKMP